MTILEGLTEKELRRLGRRDLLVCLLQQAEELSAAKSALRDAEDRHARELADRERQFAERLAAQEERANAQIKILTLRLEYERKQPASSNLIGKLAICADKVMKSARKRFPASGAASLKTNQN